MIFNAIKEDDLKDFNDLDWIRLRQIPEGRAIKAGGLLYNEILMKTYQGAGEWTFDLAKTAVAQRRAQTGRLPSVVDTQQLLRQSGRGSGSIAGIVHDIRRRSEIWRAAGGVFPDRSSSADP